MTNTYTKLTISATERKLFVAGSRASVKRFAAVNGFDCITDDELPANTTIRFFTDASGIIGMMIKGRDEWFGQFNQNAITIDAETISELANNNVILR